MTSHVIATYLTVDRHNQLNPPFIKVFGGGAIVAEFGDMPHFGSAQMKHVPYSFGATLA